MAKPLNPHRKAVDLQPRPSRIRRDPPPPPSKQSQRALKAYPEEREAWVVVIGVILFALAIAIVTIGMSEITSH